MPDAIRSLLVTGASGFVGRHLLSSLASRWPTATLHATSQQVATKPRASSAEGIDSTSSGAAGRVQWHQLDIRDLAQLKSLVRRLEPDAIIHLAAQSHVPTSFQYPELTWRVNLQGTLNLLESIKHHSPGSILLNVGSADMYGGAFRAGQPVSELTAFEPLNPYAASKAAADLAASQYAQSDNLRVVRARPFNHTGPGQTEGFVLAAFATQIARIEAGLQAPVLETGNLDAQRDFLDVHDVCKAYVALLEMPVERQRGQAYNIAYGRPVAIRDMLKALLAMSQCSISHRLDPQRQRPSDIATVAANTDALRQATDWSPSVGHDAMLRRLLDDCRRRQLT